LEKLASEGFVVVTYLMFIRVALMFETY